MVYDQFHYLARFDDKDQSPYFASALTKSHHFHLSFPECRSARFVNETA